MATTTKDTSVWYNRRQNTFDSISYAPTEGSKWKFRGHTQKLQRTRTGNTNPHWRTQVASHQNATTALDATYVSIDSRRSTINLEYLYNTGGPRIYRQTTTSGDHFFGNYSGPLGGSWTSEAELASRVKLYKLIRETQRSFSGGVFLGELRETLKMIKSPAQGLRNQLGKLWDHVADMSKVRGVNRIAKDRARSSKKAKHLYKTKEREFIRDVGTTWLENSFGLQPFLADLEDARTALDEVLETDRGKMCSAGGQARKERLSGVGQAGPLVTGTQLYYFIGTKDYEYATFRYRAYVKAKAATTWKDRAARFGFSFADFVPTMWELFPWSFLIDYFANVGDCLEAAFTDTSDVTIVGATSIVGRKTHKQIWLDRDRIISIVGGKQYILSLEESPPAYELYHQRRVIRNPNISGLVPFGLFMTRIPSFDNGANKWLNIAALLSQGIKIHPQDVNNSHYWKKWSRF